jgi:cold shock protein
MKNLKSWLAVFAMLTLFMYGCDSGGTDVVESGTYQGNVKKVVPEKTEIYVETDDNKTLELYFTDATTLTRNGETVTFDQLREGSRVEVQIEKVGQRLDPIAVRMLD